MKYIVVTMTNNEGQNEREEIFVFPRTVNHDFMMESIQTTKRGTRQNWERHYDAHAVSAGFIDNGKCHGRSETLMLESRGAADDRLLDFWLGRA